MGIKVSNVLRHELIGLEAEIVKSNNKGLVGMKGIIVDESKKMIMLETEKGEKKIEKSGSQFSITLPDHKVVKIDGSSIASRPEERIKLKVKKW